MTIVDDIREAARLVESRTEVRPVVGVVLGSGLGGLVEELDAATITSIPYEDIPHFPRSSVEGHQGRLVLGQYSGISVAVMAGRVHAYEGYTAADVVFPARVMATLGVKSLLLTNAAGAIRPEFAPGELMVISDHLNLTGLNPLAGPELLELGLRFTDMTRGYDPEHIAACEREADALGILLRKGVYAGLLGPSFETPAEIRMLRSMGADAVGMSTVLETIAARQMGVRVLGISCMTNMAAGLLDSTIDHEEVMEIGHRVQAEFARLLERVIPAIAGTGR